MTTITSPAEDPDGNKVTSYSVTITNFPEPVRKLGWRLEKFPSWNFGFIVSFSAPAARLIGFGRSFLFGRILPLPEVSTTTLATRVAQALQQPPETQNE